MESLGQESDGIQQENWYAGSISERKAEKVLAGKGVTGGFLVRSSLLPDSDYVLSVNSGSEILHYNIKCRSEKECVINQYTFPGISEIVDFYSENRLGKVFLEMPESPVVSELGVPQPPRTQIKLATTSNPLHNNAPSLPNTPVNPLMKGQETDTAPKGPDKPSHDASNTPKKLTSEKPAEEVPKTLQDVEPRGSVGHNTGTICDAGQGDRNETKRIELAADEGTKPKGESAAITRQQSGSVNQPTTAALANSTATWPAELQAESEVSRSLNNPRKLAVTKCRMSVPPPPRPQPTVTSSSKTGKSAEPPPTAASPLSAVNGEIVPAVRQKPPSPKIDNTSLAAELYIRDLPPALPPKSQPESSGVPQKPSSQRRHTVGATKKPPMPLPKMKRKSFHMDSVESGIEQPASADDTSGVVDVKHLSAVFEHETRKIFPSSSSLTGSSQPGANGTASSIPTTHIPPPTAAKTFPSPRRVESLPPPTSKPPPLPPPITELPTAQAPPPTTPIPPPIPQAPPIPPPTSKPPPLPPSITELPISPLNTQAPPTPPPTPQAPPPTTQAPPIPPPTAQAPPTPPPTPQVPSIAQTPPIRMAPSIPTQAPSTPPPTTQAPPYPNANPPGVQPGPPASTGTTPAQHPFFPCTAPISNERKPPGQGTKVKPPVVNYGPMNIKRDKNNKKKNSIIMRGKTASK